MGVDNNGLAFAFEPQADHSDFRGTQVVRLATPTHRATGHTAGRLERTTKTAAGDTCILHPHAFALYVSTSV